MAIIQNHKKTLNKLIDLDLIELYFFVMHLGLYSSWQTYQAPHTSPRQLIDLYFLKGHVAIYVKFACEDLLSLA